MQRVQSIITGVVGAPWYQNHYFLGIDGATAAQANVDAVTAYWAALDGLMDNALTIDIQGLVNEMDPSTGVITAQHSVTPGQQIGDSAGLPLPYQTQGLIQWNTDLFVGGHRLVGRSFLPGFTADTLESNGTPTSGTLTGIAAAVTAILAGAQPLAVWSRTHQASAVVATGTVRDKFYVLRTRRD